MRKNKQKDQAIIPRAIIYCKVCACDDHVPSVVLSDPNVKLSPSQLFPMKPPLLKRLSIFSFILLFSAADSATFNASEHPRTFTEGCSSVMRYSIRVFLNQQSIYDRLLGRMQLRSKVDPEKIHSRQQFCEAVQFVGEDRLEEAAELAGDMGECEIANECLNLRHHFRDATPRPGLVAPIKTPLEEIYKRLLQENRLNAFTCLIREDAAKPSNSPEAFLKCVELALDCNGIINKCSEFYPLIIGNLSMPALLRNEEHRSKFTGLILASMTKENLDFFLALARSYASVLDLSKFKGDCKSEKYLIDDEEEEVGAETTESDTDCDLMTKVCEMGILRLLFRKNEKMTSEPHCIRHIVHRLLEIKTPPSTKVPVSYNDIEELFFDLASNGKEDAVKPLSRLIELDKAKKEYRKEFIKAYYWSVIGYVERNFDDKLPQFEALLDMLFGKAWCDNNIRFHGIAPTSKKIIQRPELKK